jgi:D-beta-D-heptose 7-phosphate kinase/D-beta-D-heptose 1-phosphate adenosyltransferase
MDLTIRRARELLEKFPDRHLAVVGDLILDRYLIGTVDRISPEAPVPVIHVHSERVVPGGASNVAANLRALGARVTVCGVVGDDTDGNELLRLLKRFGVDTRGVLRCPRHPTTVKTRIVAERQQVCRVDREKKLEWNTAQLRQALAWIRRCLADVNAVILEDYGKGYLTQEIVDQVRSIAAAAERPVGLDPKENHALDVRDLTLITPNRREAFHAAGVSDPGPASNPLQDAPLANVARRLMTRWRPKCLLVTLGPHGMLLVQPRHPPHHIPTRALEVYDVSGAGDTVIATAMLALAAGASPLEAAELANFAAGVVVGKLGTATCAPNELLQHMRECGAPEA